MSLKVQENKMTTGGSDMELKTEILIIGGGASGMAAAVAAAEMGAEVTLSLIHILTEYFAITIHKKFLFRRLRL